MSDDEAKEQKRVAAIARVANRKDRRTEILDYVLQQVPRKKGEFVPMTELLASDLAWLLSRHDAAMHLLKVGVGDGWMHEELQAAKALVEDDS